MTKKAGKKVAKSKPKAVAVVRSATPADLLQMAVQQGADIDKMKQLMDMQERWEANEARKAFTVSMTAFRADPPMIFKDKLVSYKNKDGTMTEYYHPSLATMAAAIGEALSPHGLSYRWGTAQDMQAGGMITVTCILTHVLGHSESVPLSGTPDESGGKNKIQAVGSTVKYLERYTLEAITGVVSQDMDDDGQAAGGSQEPEYISEHQIADLRALMEEIGVEEEKFLEVFKLESLDKIYAEKYDDAVKRIESKRKSEKV